MRALLPAIAVVLAVAAAGCGSSNATSTRASSTTKRTLTDIQSVDQLRQAFNTASREPRLVVIVSPT